MKSIKRLNERVEDILKTLQNPIYRRYTNQRAIIDIKKELDCVYEYVEKAIECVDRIERRMSYWEI